MRFWPTRSPQQARAGCEIYVESNSGGYDGPTLHEDWESRTLRVRQASGARRFFRGAEFLLLNQVRKAEWFPRDCGFQPEGRGVVSTPSPSSQQKNPKQLVSSSATGKKSVEEFAASLLSSAIPSRRPAPLPRKPSDARPRKRKKYWYGPTLHQDGLQKHIDFPLQGPELRRGTASGRVLLEQ